MFICLVLFTFDNSLKLLIISLLIELFSMVVWFRFKLRTSLKRIAEFLIIFYCNRILASLSILYHHLSKIKGQLFMARVLRGLSWLWMAGFVYFIDLVDCIDCIDFIDSPLRWNIFRRSFSDITPTQRWLWRSNPLSWFDWQWLVMYIKWLNLWVFPAKFEWSG